jgi:muconolactone delta-isomerase
MPQYQVTMNLTRADPLLNIGQLTQIVAEAILPSLEALKDLQSKGKVLAGGHPVGQRYVVLFMEAESEDEIHELLKDLPLSELGKTEVTELKPFEVLGSRSESAASRDLLP